MAKLIENFSSAVKNGFRTLTTLRPAGGLSISNSAIRYVRLEGSRITSSVSISLSPGIVDDIKIKDQSKVLEALRILRSKVNITQSKKAEVILSFDSGPVYSQFFTLPSLSPEGINEAANLNVQMLSPMNIAESYYGYEMVGGDIKSGENLEFLSAFVESKSVDDWLSVLREAGFFPVAVEFRSLSLVRFLSSLKLIDSNKIYLLVDVNVEGINLIIIKNNHLYFDYFYSWKSIQSDEREISVDKLKSVLASEISKVINFSLSKFGSEVKDILINAEGLQNEIFESVKDQFKNVSVTLVNAPILSSASLSASLGAAFRGLLGRSEDKSITLSPVSVIDEYYQTRVLELADLWRNILVPTLVVIVFIFASGAYMLNRIDNQSAVVGEVILSPSDTKELSELRDEVTKFNSMIGLVASAKLEENKFSPLISKIAQAGSGEIAITRLSFQSINDPIVLNGTAPSPESVIRFSDKLKSYQDLVSDIKLPISSLIPSSSGTTSFSISFKIRTLNID